MKISLLGVKQTERNNAGKKIISEALDAVGVFQYPKTKTGT